MFWVTHEQIFKLGGDNRNMKILLNETPDPITMIIFLVQLHQLIIQKADSLSVTLSWACNLITIRLFHSYFLSSKVFYCLWGWGKQYNTKIWQIHLE